MNDEGDEGAADDPPDAAAIGDIGIDEGIFPERSIENEQGDDGQYERGLERVQDLAQEILVLRLFILDLVWGIMSTGEAVEDDKRNTCNNDIS